MKSEQFKRVVVGLFNSKQLSKLDQADRAVAAVEIARSNLVRSGFLTRDSLLKPPDEMIETSKGKRASRKKRTDGTHNRKMVEFEKIWAMYAEKVSKEKAGG